MTRKTLNLKTVLLGSVLILSQFLVANSSFGQASTSVYKTGKYRNLQVDYDGEGSDPANRWYADYKLLVNYQWMFGFSSSGADDVIFYNVSGTNEGYIKDIEHNDIRSEGISYGMMIAVQMNDQATFDKLWRFAKSRMRQSDGHFAWHVNTSDYKPIGGTGGAPDGEEYMAMALFFAANRWGANSTSLDYTVEANKILEVIRSQYWDSGSGINMIRFLNGVNYTDPSYHLPAFYELWGLWASSNNKFWKDAAASSRAYLKKAAHGTTGLFAEYMNYDGTATAPGTNMNNDSGRFAYDSWRVIQNMAMDYYWWSADSELKTIVERQQTFFKNQGMTAYKDRFELNGSVVGTNHSQGHVMMNAVGSLVGTGSLSQDFVKDAWAMQPPTGTYRYYGGLLHLFGLMHISGNYRIYGSGAAAFTTDQKAANKQMAQLQISLVNTTPTALSNFTANYYITVENGKTPIVQDISTPSMNVSMVQINGNLWAAKMNYAGKTLEPGARIPASGTGDSFAIAYSDGSTFDKSNDYSQPIGTDLIASTDRISVFNSQGKLVMGKDPLIKTIVVRARGTAGGEQITLKVNNTAVQSWTLNTTTTNYTATTSLSGGSLVQYTNDSPNHDVVVDYISVDGVVRQAEEQTVNTGYFTGTCGGGGIKSEWMHCNGYIGFGNL